MPGREDYLRFFQEADADGSGALTLDELTAILKKKGYKASDKEINRMFKSVDKSGDGLISMDEYMAAMSEEPPATHKEAAMRSCFQGFDKNGDGTIDCDELKAAWKEMGKHLGQQETDRLMAIMDTDGSGSVDYEEFIAAVFGKKK